MKYQSRNLDFRENETWEIGDNSINYELWEFTRKIVNFNDKNDIILIKWKINRKEPDIKVLLKKYYSNILVWLTLLVLVTIFYKKKKGNYNYINMNYCINYIIYNNLINTFLIINLPPIYQDITSPITNISFSWNITPNTDLWVNSYVETTLITLILQIIYDEVE